MWEIQPDWAQLNNFYVNHNNTKYSLTWSNGETTTSDPSIQLSNIQNRSFSITTQDGQSCAFIAPKRSLKIHNGDSVNCVDVSKDGKEILSGDSKGRLFLTYIGTDPVPLPGPTADFDLECCIFDHTHKLFFACGGDFRIYEYSATEYQATGRYDGHKSSVKHIAVKENSLFSGSYDCSIMKWDISKRSKISTYQVNSQVNDFCFTSSDLLIAATEQRLKSIDIKTGLPAAAPNLGKSTSFNCCASFENDIVAGTNDGEVAIWDIRNTDTPVAVWSWYDSPINKLSYNGNKLWVGTNDGTAALIDVREKRSLALLGTQAYAPVRDLAYNDVSAWTADGEGTLLFFEL
ncbi:hypothetical protein TRFO_42635 [Tritrichomonas foetus]|uniref:Uncharacterized protein n=1 Tax=Tritrichomonas foetus TaxID=1144522 RepID=A0A1J4L043_9EUKA|nr:hypothetical protein TRFO_42635 [Tritrichomonas foetus]|eukprot:OHT15221.1 hypothetical protein TRFO_42635 [Tritrichomonas foetus]